MSSHPMYRIRKNNRGAVHPSLKRTIKYMASCSNPLIQRMILNSANDSVYKSICNAFFNMAENPEIKIPSNRKKLLKSFNPRIQKLISAQIPIKKKKLIIQKGGGVFLGTILPLVLSGALSILGSNFLSKNR